MLKEAEILKFIQDDNLSTKKQNARIGAEYYEGEHEIRNYKLFYYDSDGNLVEDKTRSNIKISHPFFTELVDQETQYMLGADDGFIKSDLPELQSELDAYFNDNEDFTSELSEVVTGSITKGFEYMYAYKDSHGKIAFQCADSIGVVEVRARDTDDATEYVIYWYVSLLNTCM